MTMELINAEPKRSRFGKVVEFTFSFFLRLLAIIFFAASLYAWARTVGIWVGAGNRFDTMSTMMRINAAVMLVLLPVTSVGLWTTLSWGRVVWFIAIGFQTVATLRFGVELGLPKFLVTFHLGCLGIYLLFQILLYFIEKKE